MLDRRIEELLDLGEGDDLVEFEDAAHALMPRIAPFKKMFSRLSKTCPKYWWALQSGSQSRLNYTALRDVIGAKRSARLPVKP
jgi:hypothetical protein